MPDLSAETAAGAAWDADAARGYFEFVLRQEVERFIGLFGEDALDRQVEAVKRGETEETEQ